MQEFHYEIMSINEKERWIFLHTDERDYGEPDSFIYLVKKIRDDLQGEIIDHGMITYSIDKDPYRLTYQWDSCFGITVVYPHDVKKGEAVEFISKYL